MAFKYPFLIAFFCISFFIGGCTTSNKGLNLADNILKVHVTPGWPNSSFLYKGQTRYSLYQLRRPQNGGNSIARLNNYDSHISVQGEPISSGDAIDSIVSFRLPYDRTISNSCVVVVNVGSWVTPIMGRRGLDSRHTIGLQSYGVIYNISKLKEEKNIILRDTKIAKNNIYKTRSYRNGTCYKERVSLPRKPNSAYSPSDAESIAEAVVFEAMARRLGCEVLSEILRSTRLIGAWDRFEHRFSCGRNNLNSLYPVNKYTPIVDFIESMLLSCSTRNTESRKGCMLSYGGMLVGRFIVEKNLVYEKLTKPYLRWKREVNKLELVVQQDYSACKKYKSLIDNSDGAISTVQFKIEEEEKRLFRKGLNKNEDGNFFFEADSLACNTSLVDYSTKKGGYIGVR